MLSLRCLMSTFLIILLISLPFGIFIFPSAYLKPSTVEIIKHYNFSNVSWPQIGSDVSKPHNGSDVSCVIENAGPTCIFRNVCILPDGIFFLVWMNKTKLPVMDIVPAGIRFPTLLGHQPFITFQAIGQMPPMNLFMSGTTVYMGLYGAENWGHHISDTWYGFFRLREISGDSDARLLLFQNCSEYNWLVTGLVTAESTEEMYINSCQSHVARLTEALNISTIMVRSIESKGDVSLCYERLIVGAATLAWEWSKPSSVERYRDFIIRRFGRDPNYKPTKERVVILRKVGKDSRNRHVFTNLDELCDELRNRLKIEVHIFEISKHVPIVRQIDEFLNATILITPGGGLAFSGLFLAKNAKMLVSPYPFIQEQKNFHKLSCFLKVAFWSASCDGPGLGLGPMTCTYPIEQLVALISSSSAFSCEEK